MKNRRLELPFTRIVVQRHILPTRLKMKLSVYPTPNTEYQGLTEKLSAPYPTPYPTPRPSKKHSFFDS